MRLLYLDIDTLRPDHLGCYGYERPTSPNIDSLAADGIRFDQVYVSDSPCLPSRSALVTGRFGVTNGVVNHGGRRSEPFAEGRERGRRSELAATSWPSLFQQQGMWCTTISTFAERHSAYHWYAGFNEVHNLGAGGEEQAHDVTPLALEWLARRGRDADWFLHVHFWDPHTPYRTPPTYAPDLGPAPAAGWLDEDVLARHWQLAGPHSAQEVLGFGPVARFDRYPRQPQQVATAHDVRSMFDGYDWAVRYVDDHVGRILAELESLGIAEETTVLLSSDHGETLGELGIYCDHQTADLHTHRVPAVLRGPGLGAGRTDDQLRYQVDLAATLVELAGGEVPPSWDGIGFLDDLVAGSAGPTRARDHLVLSSAAWATQRSVRFGRWLCVRTYHDAFHDFAPVMLFDVEADPHEQHDVAAHHPEVVAEAARLLLDWEAAAMERSPSGVDPVWTVIHEGGGYYTRDRLVAYLERLEQTGRAAEAKRIAARLTPPSVGPVGQP